MNITVSLNKLPCDHVRLTFTSPKGSVEKLFTLSQLKTAMNPDSVEEVVEMVLAQMKKLVLDNPSATTAQLKTLIESTTFKV